MPIPGRRSNAGDIASRSRLIVILLVISLLLVLALAWQAQRAASTHLQTATGVLQDYGRLVADEFARRAMSEIGYYGYFTYVNHLRSQSRFSGNSLTVQPAEADSPAARASELAGGMYLINMASERINFSHNEIIPVSLQVYLREQARIFAGAPLPETRFRVLHYKDEDRSRTFVMTATDDLRRVYGFEVDRQRLSAWLEKAFGREPLLPGSLAGGAVTNDHVYLRITDGSERDLFETGPASDPYLLVSKQLGDDYQGIFSAHTIFAAIDPAIADSLIIGGLPRSRLPFLLIVMLLTVGLLIAAIRQLQRERAVMRMRSNFVSEVSHELRTPLTQIRMFAETLLFDRVRSDDERHRAVEVINRESQRLIHLVENVLLFADERRSERKTQIVVQPLAPLVERAVAEFRPLAAATNATIECDLADAAINAVDSDALRQILLNLLDNAVKYGPDGQRIVVSLLQKNGRTLLAVSDEGPGIPREDRERIWGGYYRLERERDSAIAGTGIGLAVVRELAGRHGGRTWVEQTQQGGARFVIEFPALRQTGTATSIDASDGQLPEGPA